MTRSILFIIILIIILAIIGYFSVNNSQTKVSETPDDINVLENISQEKNIEQQVQVLSPVPQFDGIIHTINTDQVELEFFRENNKVVLMHFWTYGCINCKRTLDIINEWYDKYHDDGLEVVGVHTPEFAFEQKIQNVQDFVIERQIIYPVLLDNEFKTWRNYKNRYWPHRYVITDDGIVFDHIGEGAYEETEAIIRELLGLE